MIYIINGLIGLTEDLFIYMLKNYQKTKLKLALFFSRHCLKILLVKI